MMENYEKIRVVGRGAYGTVFLCRRLADKKLVIIKQIPVEQMTKEERQTALNEVRVLSMLDHPYIIEYYENFLEDKALMIVMEYAQGGTLFECLQQRSGQLMEEEEILKFLAQMLLSIQHVHSKQILHRDLKTQNILLDKKQETVKIGDFGISKVLSSKSKAYTVVGTPCYISPELCEGKPYNQKSDIWALGCVLYELATLKRAFEAPNLPALILKIMRGTFSPISDHYSEDLSQLILTMLHLDPNKRPDINQIMAQPIVLNALMNLYTDFGKVPCRRNPRPLSSLPGPNRNRVSQGGSIPSKGSSASITPESIESLTSKPPARSSAYLWGNGITTPLKMPLPSSDTLITEVSTGRTTKAAVTKNGRLFVWESAGLGTEPALPGLCDSGMPAYIPRYLEGQTAVSIQHVACGDLFTACLTDRGILMTYGSGANGCLGHGSYADVGQAKIVETLLGFEVVEVSCGTSHVLAVTNEHEVFAWGRGDSGRLGLGTQESHCTPQLVAIPAHYKPSSVRCGIDRSMVITHDSRLLSCGSNSYNKLALDDGEPIEEIALFTQMRTPPLRDMRVSHAAMGTSHSAIISENGICFTMGSNQFGQLGYPKVHPLDRQPGKITIPGDHDKPITKVSCGDTFTVVVTEDGELYSSGKATRGRLGRVDQDNHLPGLVHLDEGPVMVTSISSSHGTTLVATKPVQRPGSPIT